VLAVVTCTCARLSGYVDGRPLEGPDWPELLPHLETVDVREALSWFTGDWVQHNGYYRPVSSYSLLLDYLVVGEHRPVWWRVHNLLLMASVAALLAVLTRALTGSDAAGLVAGVVSMGARTEGAVMFRVSPRTDVLCALFLPASLLWMLSWARGGRPGFLAAALVAAGLSVLSKEAGLLLGALAPLTLWAGGASQRRITVAAGACLAVLLVYWLARSHFLQVPAWSLSMPVRQFPLHSRGLVVLRTVLPVAWSVHAWAGFVPIQLLLATTWLRALGDLAGSRNGRWWRCTGSVSCSWACCGRWRPWSPSPTTPCFRLSTFTFRAWGTASCGVAPWRGRPPSWAGGSLARGPLPSGGRHRRPRRSGARHRGMGWAGGPRRHGWDRRLRKAPQQERSKELPRSQDRAHAGPRKAFHRGGWRSIMKTRRGTGRCLGGAYDEKALHFPGTSRRLLLATLFSPPVTRQVPMTTARPLPCTYPDRLAPTSVHTYGPIPTDWDCEYHSHAEPDWEIQYIARGTASYLLESAERRLGAGELLIISPEQPHRCQTWQGLRQVVIFRDSSLNALPLDLRRDRSDGLIVHERRLPRSFRVPSAARPPLEAILAQLQRESLAAEPLARAMCSALLSQMLLVLAREAPGAEGAAAPPATDAAKLTIDQLCAEVKTSLDHPWTLEEMVRRSGYSAPQLCRLFAQVTSLSPCRWVREERVRRAADLLVGTVMRTEQIAAEVGFQGRSQLHRAFRAYMGLSPGEYRRALHLDR